MEHIVYFLIQDDIENISISSSELAVTECSSFGVNLWA